MRIKMLGVSDSFSALALSLHDAHDTHDCDSGVHLSCFECFYTRRWSSGRAS